MHRVDGFGALSLRFSAIQREKRENGLTRMPQDAQSRERPYLRPPQNGGEHDSYIETGRVKAPALQKKKKAYLGLSGDGWWQCAPLTL